MTRRLVVLAAAALFLIGLGCSGGSGPIAPDKESSVSPEESLGAIDLSGMTIGEFSFTDLEGRVLTSGLLGRDEDGGLYVIDSRGAQTGIDFTVLKLVNAYVTYKNPAGTAGNGLPYYYRGNTMIYEVSVMSYGFADIGSPGNLARVVTEMHRAYVNTVTKEIVIGPLMYGDSVYTWEGVIPPGVTKIRDDYYIHPSNPSGNFVTTVEVSLPLLYGTVEILFFDGVAGVFDPQ